MSEWQTEIVQHRRAVILEAAASVFATKGFTRATVKEIAERAGIAPGTIYLYFENKRELLLSIAEQLAELMPDELELPPQNVSEAALVQQLLDQMLLALHSRWDFIRALAAEMWTDEELRRDYLLQGLGPLLNIVEARLQTHIDRREIRPLDTGIVTRAIVGAVATALIAAEVGVEDLDDPARRQHLSGELARFFLYGLQGHDA